MLTLLLSQEDQALLEDIEELIYGELFNIERSNGKDGFRHKEVTDRTAVFFKALTKYERFDRVIIHDCEPVGAEMTITTASGRKALRKLRFN